MPIKDIEEIDVDWDDEPDGSPTGKSGSTGFEKFLLKEPLIRAIGDRGFRHPSEVQELAIPQAIQGHDANSGLGKTAIFVLATLQQMKEKPELGSILVICPTHELAYQIKDEYDRFAKYLPNVKVGVFIGGIPIRDDIKTLSDESTYPHIVVGTPGRIDSLITNRELSLRDVKHVVLDECDKTLVDTKNEVLSIFNTTPPPKKQVMMFSATISEDTRVNCKDFMKKPLEIFVDNLTLQNSQHYFIELQEKEKYQKLYDIVNELAFEQIIIFVRLTHHCTNLGKWLDYRRKTVVHSGISQEERLKRYKELKEKEITICVATDVLSRGIHVGNDVVVVNYDMPGTAVDYVHRVGRAGRFGSKSQSISFVTPEDEEVLKSIQGLKINQSFIREVKDLEKD